MSEPIFAQTVRLGEHGSAHLHIDANRVMDWDERSGAQEGFCERLHSQRRKLRLTYPALARRFGCHPNTIYNWESAPKPIMPSREKLERLAGVLGVTVAWLTGDDTPQKPCSQK